LFEDHGVLVVAQASEARRSADQLFAPTIGFAGLPHF
jgi:hypothetical protein